MENESLIEEKELSEDNKMGLLGRGRWFLGISVRTKWKIIPLALAIWFLLSAVLSQHLENIVIALLALIGIILFLRRV